MPPNIHNPLVNDDPNANVVDVATVNAAVCSSVFTNSVIMRKIFDYLTVDELKEARTICKIWGADATTCLGQRGYLSINKFIGSCQDEAKAGSPESPSIEDQLLRKVNIDNTLTSTGGGLDVGKKIDYDFLTFVKEYQEHEEIQFNVNRHFAPTLKFALENFHFSRLNKIQLLEDVHSTKSIAGYGWDAFDYLNFLPLPTLTMLKISGPENIRGRNGPFRVDEKDGFPYYQIVQEIIKKSPNLEKLEIGENFYPDLSSCKQLKVLNYKGYPFKPIPLLRDEDDEGNFEIVSREDFDVSKMLKMLHQVKDTLEELVLDMDAKYYRAKTIEGLVVPLLQLSEPEIKFPCLQNLKTLVIYPFESYLRGLGFEQGTKKQLPSLKKLTLKEFNGERGSLVEVILGLKTCWENVQDLYLDGLRYEVDDPTIFMEKIVKTFPNTKMFHLSIKGDLEEESEPIIFQRFKYAVSAIATADWKVENLEIYVGFRSTVSKLMDALGQVVSLNGFKRLKSLKLSSTCILDDGWMNFEEPFMGLRSLTFCGIKFKASTLIKMAKFIERNDLNIQFFDVD